jgi:hypothetical protein
MPAASPHVLRTATRFSCQRITRAVAGYAASDELFTELTGPGHPESGLWTEQRRDLSRSHRTRRNACGGNRLRRVANPRMRLSRPSQGGLTETGGTRIFALRFERAPLVRRRSRRPTRTGNSGRFASELNSRVQDPAVGFSPTGSKFFCPSTRPKPTQPLQTSSTSAEPSEGSREGTLGRRGP